ncbi:sigma-54-dependent transcriptional regulator [Engelhardtia mirabilis]|uniref:sigma-54 interaction domain-containing protein n=1 Tax=Engelhardtia mirabilis TaxID=2528011 RepID=UPI0011AA2E1D
MNRRRLTLAVPDPDLARRLAALLEAHEIDVVHRPTALPGASSAADAVIVRADSVGDGAAGSPTEPDLSGVIVLGEQTDAAEQVRLMAAGASGVLDVGSTREDLAEQLAELVEAEASGGVDGPEARGFDAEPRLADFQSRSSLMRDFLDVVRRVADTDSTLLITGETGVGKERLARAVHAESGRAAGPFVAVNCAALSENLLESELFGHERGAFTGASAARQGHFEAAGGGTILLDEIGEMPLHLQVKLLTVLQRHEVQRVGASTTLPIDVRVIAATNRDLAVDVREGRFRQDLLFRLNVISLVIPPLRERVEDVPQMTGRFLRHFAEVHGRASIGSVDGGAMAALLSHDWPGNVRELVNVVERAVLLCDGDRLTLDDLPDSVRRQARPESQDGVGAELESLAALPLSEARRRQVDAFERRYLEHHLRETRGTVGEVARRARINPRTLYDKLRRHGLDKADYR